jgi:hypothetical protein
MPRVRTYEISTYCDGSKFPPCSMALIKISRKAIPDVCGSRGGRAAIFFMNWTSRSALFMSQRTSMQIHSGVADTTLMPSSHPSSVALRHHVPEHFESDRCSEAGEGPLPDGRDNVRRRALLGQDDKTHVWTNTAHRPQQRDILIAGGTGACDNKIKWSGVGHLQCRGIVFRMLDLPLFRRQYCHNRGINLPVGLHH